MKSAAVAEQKGSPPVSFCCSSRKKLEGSLSVDNGIALKETTAKYRGVCLQAAISRNKLWKLTKVMNGEDARANFKGKDVLPKQDTETIPTYLEIAYHQAKHELPKAAFKQLVQLSDTLDDTNDDESTDIGNKKQLLAYIQYLDQDGVRCALLENLLITTASAYADTIIDISSKNDSGPSPDWCTLCGTSLCSCCL
ncbi:hypothetical protein DPMN_173386 [Dreissena polymorpha]|uniref:Uncharacterized protein n=1 Tax=Dreissena polymorpha TaxID=45954 RepID=A0A9D4IG16_DREPO|nr:hypothetical protein DPMN_173386 [Dreissena polymorpha]